MSIDGPQTNLDQAASETFDLLSDGLRNNSITEAVTNADDRIAGMSLTTDQRLQLGQAVQDRLQAAGLLPRVAVEYGTANFDSLAAGDRYIHTLDLDNVLMAGQPATSPIRGLITRTLRNSIDSIATQHDDYASRDWDSREADEIAKGISMRDLTKWGESHSNRNFHTAMSSRMMTLFGSREKFSTIAGGDMELDKDEIDSAKTDTVRFDSGQQSVLQYMRDNYGSIKSTRDGDGGFTLSDVVDWSARYGVPAEQGLVNNDVMQPRLSFQVDDSNRVASATGQGVEAIVSGLRQGSVSQAVRDFDRHLTTAGYTGAEISAITSGIGTSLQGNNLMRRTMGQFGAENFDFLKGDNKYIHASELDTFLQSNIHSQAPTEAMLLGTMRRQIDIVAMHHDDVRNNDSDSAEQSRGMSLKDLTKFRDSGIDYLHHRDMSTRMLTHFGSTESFNNLSGDGQLDDNEIDAAKTDTFKYSPDQLATLSYMRDNYRGIKSSVDGDGRRMSLSDVLAHAGKYGVTPESIRDAELEPEIRVAEVEELPQARIVETQQARVEEAQQIRIEQPPRVERAAVVDTRLGPPDVEDRIKITSSDRFWDLAIKKYNEPAIEAIFEANGLRPTVTDNNGVPEISDPIYHEGKEYVLPRASDIPALTEQYRVRAEQLREATQSRVGAAGEATEVKLMYGDTFSALALQKYGRAIPYEAIYEANNLPPRVVQKPDGQICYLEPIYQAGKTYVMPPADQIEALARAYRQKYFNG